MRITVTVNLTEGKVEPRLLKLLFDVARTLNATVTTTQKEKL